MSNAAKVKRENTTRRRRVGGGGLRIFGLLWLVAADDFVFTALCEFITRVVGLCILIGLLVYVETEEYTCVRNNGLNVYLYVAMAVMVLGIANVIVLGLSSARGPDHS